MSDLDSHEKFDGIGLHAETIETRARIGESYLEAYESALSDPLLAGYTPADCPSELLLDMLEMLRHRVAGQAELASEVQRLHSLAKANNDLARRYAEQIQSLRGAAVLALELIEEIEDEEGFSPSVAIPAQALRAALQPFSQSKGEG